MITLGKNQFDVPAPAGMRSFSLQQRILPVAGRIVSVLAHLLGLGDGDLKSMLDKDLTAILPEAAPEIGRIFSEMPPGELEGITRELLRDAKCDKMPLFGASGDPFDLLMRGRTTDTWKLLWHALEVWYPDFFGLARGYRAAASQASPSEESSTSLPSGPAGV